MTASSSIQTQPKRIPAGKKVRILVAVGCFVLMAVLIVQNTEEVRTTLLFADVRMPRAILLLATSGFGFVLGYLFALWRRLRKR